MTTIRKYAFDVSALVFVMTIGLYVFFPNIAKADVNQDASTKEHALVAMTISAMQNETKNYGVFPISQNAKARKTYRIPVTAYTSDPRQTDETPCITASGMDVCVHNTEDVVAANFLPMGARVRIPEFYGDRVFTVQDRMNARYDQHMDVWMKNLDDAKKFGLKFTTVEVF